MSLTRDTTKAAQVLDRVKEVLRHNAARGFTRDSNQFDIGYTQACRDLQQHIKLAEMKSQ